MIIRKLLTLLKYIFSVTLIKDVIAITKYHFKGGADIIFFCYHPVDYEWIKSTSIKCEQSKYKSIIIINNEFGRITSLEGKDNVYYTSLLGLKFFIAPVFITASIFSSEKYFPFFCKYKIHMPHSLASLHMIYPEGSFDSFNVLFACGQHHIEEYQKMTSNMTARKVYQIGYGKMDLLLEEYQNKKKDNPYIGQKTILIAPSWGVQNILENIGQELISRLLYEGYRVVIRPHPSFFVYNSSLLIDINNLFGNNEKFILEKSINRNYWIYHADLLISDYSGIAYEYAFLRQKPVLFINVPPKVKNPNWVNIELIPMELNLRQSVGILVEPDIEDIIKHIRSLMGLEEQYQERIRTLIPGHIFNFGSCSSYATEQIIRFIELRGD